MKKTALLRITGIIMLIAAALALADVFLLEGILGLSYGWGGVGFVLLTSIGGVVLSCVQLIAGIAGASAKRPKLCVTLGWILILLSLVINAFYYIVQTGSLQIASLISGLLIPVLYLFGAYYAKR